MSNYHIHLYHCLCIFSCYWFLITHRADINHQFEWYTIRYAHANKYKIPGIGQEKDR